MSFENLKDDQLRALEGVDGYKQACSLIDLLEAAGFEAYLVGGCVRDVLLGRELKDFDMCTSAQPEEMKEIFKDYKLLLQGEAFGTISVVIDKQAFEITTFRGDGVYADSRHPETVEFKASLKEDLSRRDFTINALAFNPKKGLVDLVGGLKDHNSKVLQTVGDPEARFDEDALRIARLIRFAVQLGFEIDQRSFDAALDKSPLLKKISNERVYIEFKKMLGGVPHLSVVDQIFKTSFESLFPPDKKLDLFEKAYIALELSKRLGVVTGDYVKEKVLKDKCSALEKMSETDDVKSDFIKICDKNALYEEDQLRLWKLVCLLNTRALKIKVLPYSNAEISDVTQKLKQQYVGRDLGDAIFNFKIKKFFQDELA